jgi:hypothetical protein
MATWQRHKEAELYSSLQVNDSDMDLNWTKANTYEARQYRPQAISYTEHTGLEILKGFPDKKLFSDRNPEDISSTL